VSAWFSPGPMSSAGGRHAEGDHVPAWTDARRFILLSGYCSRVADVSRDISRAHQGFGMRRVHLKVIEHPVVHHIRLRLGHPLDAISSCGRRAARRLAADPLSATDGDQRSRRVRRRGCPPRICETSGRGCRRRRQRCPVRSSPLPAPRRRATNTSVRSERRMNGTVAARHAGQSVQLRNSGAARVPDKLRRPTSGITCHTDARSTSRASRAMLAGRS
jgi:hypothetical protein